MARDVGLVCVLLEESGVFGLCPAPLLATCRSAQRAELAGIAPLATRPRHPFRAVRLNHAVSREFSKVSYHGGRAVSIKRELDDSGVAAARRVRAVVAFPVDWGPGDSAAAAGAKQESRPLPFKRRRINVKSEPTEFGAGVSPPLASPPPPLFTKMLPGWIQDCIDFQKAHRTWSPARPCCPANYFLSEMGPSLPPREGQKMQSRYHRLTKPQQREFRRYIESGEEDHAVLAKLAAENAVARPSSRGLSKEPGAFMWPWMRDLQTRLRTGLTPDGAQRLQGMAGCDIIPGSQMWDSRAARGPEEVEILLNSDDAELWPELFGIQWWHTCFYTTTPLRDSWKFLQWLSKSLHAFREQLHFSQLQALGILWQAKAAKPSSLLVPGDAEAIASTAGQGSSGASPGTRVRAAVASTSSSGKPVRVIARQSKQSGISGISWSSVNMGWHIQYNNQKDAKRSKQLHFIFKQYQKPGMSWEEADEAAFLAAKVAREDLINRGNMKDTDGMRPKPKFTSNVLGVTWTQSRKSWKYQLRDGTNGQRKYLGSGSVKAKDTSEAGILRAQAEAEEKMNELYDKHGWPRHVWGADKEVKSASELVKRVSSVTGVTWMPTESSWVAWARINGKQHLARFRPKDETPEEIERCFQECVAARRELKERKAHEEKPKK
ncbi:unnamed protein product [Polarella glacialis]|uniref:Uncharacterized protein n=1 Tax=Polarella glacialis TaxID=89957 RepID=A0A813ICM2_POLGL|nr:unnamed protein product [Polarella glacialis]